jgi:hypothetical protein
VTCASAHAPVHGEREEGGTNKTGPWRRERKGGCVGATAGHWRSRPVRQRERESEREREREQTGEGNWRRQVGPIEQRAREGGHARGRTVADRRGPPVRRRGRTGAQPGRA